MMIRTLVVEDEPPILKSISRMIEATNEQFQVVSQALDGKEAIDILQNTQVDVVFTDVSMPVLDGLAVCKFLYENQPDVKIVILSGYNDFKYAQQAIRYSVYDYILKPLRKSDLAKLLEKLQKIIQNEHSDAACFALYNILHENEEVRAPVLSKAENLYVVSVFAGAYPLSGFDYLSSGRCFLDSVDLHSLLEQFLLPQEKFFLIGGKSANEKILILSLSDRMRIQKIMTKLLIFLTAEGQIPVTLLHSPPLDGIH